MPGSDRSPVTIDAALARRLIARQFPRWAALPVREVERSGWDNRTFRLGDELSVRLPSARHYVAQVDKEQRWLPWLAPRLPLAIARPVARGEPDAGYPWPWSVYQWLDGTDAGAVEAADAVAFGSDLAGFLRALQAVPSRDGPPAGTHNFHRGGPLGIYDGEVRRAVTALDERIDGAAVLGLWQACVDTTWPGPPVWVHGDVAPGNLLLREGALAAVIDFGCCAVGDPACDLAIAWTSFSGAARAAFLDTLDPDRATRARGRGWALWKALITLAGAGSSPRALQAAQVIESALADGRTERPDEA